MTSLSELHKKTLASYIKKATQKHGQLQWKRGNLLAHGKGDSVTTARSNKRLAGVGLAADKLTKEEVVNEVKFEKGDKVYIHAPADPEWHGKAGVVHHVSELGGLSHVHVKVKGHRIPVLVGHHMLNVRREETNEEANQMTRFIDLAAGKQAATFQTQLEAILTGKIGSALEAYKSHVAETLFAEAADEAAMPDEGEKAAAAAAKAPAAQVGSEPAKTIDAVNPQQKAIVKQTTEEAVVEDEVTAEQLYATFTAAQTGAARAIAEGNNAKAHMYQVEAKNAWTALVALNEKVVKVKGGYENIGKTGKRHGVMSKKKAMSQKAAMFANGFKG